jgi:single-strand DNA-binding protein
MNVNKVMIAGRLTRDPQLRYLPNTTPICEFGVVMNRKYKVGDEDRDEATFVDCQAWGKTAEVINQHLAKGKEIFIEGRLKYEAWEDKNGGGKRSKLLVVVDNFQFVGGRADGDAGGAPSTPRPTGAVTRTSPPRRAAPTQSTLSEKPQFAEADIPF